MASVAARAPGTYSSRSTATPSGTPGPDTGQAFFAGITERGPVGAARTVTSHAQARAIFGGRLATSQLDDAVDVFFREGGGKLTIARNVGASAATATANLAGTSGTTLIVNAANPGTWGNNLTVSVEVSGTDYRLIVKLDGEEVQQSAWLATRDEAVAAFADSDYIRVVVGAGTGDPVAVTNTALAGGTNGTTSDATRAAALALFTPDLGEGQVAVPGDTSTTAHAQLMVHGAAHNRIPLLDYADSSAATTAAAIIAARATEGSERAAHIAVVATAPGGPAGSTREIPYSAVLAAQAAEADRLSVPGQALAGDRGVAKYVTGLVREYTEADRLTLNEAGATVAILDQADQFGRRRVTTFSDRTGSDRSDPEVVHELSDARVLMAVEARLRHRMRPYRFAQITQAKEAEITGALTTVGSDLFDAGVITADETGEYSSAFSVEVEGDAANRQWIVNAYPRPSRVGEVIQINTIRLLVEG